MNKYYSLVTDIGTAAITNAALTGGKIDITDFAVGDGGGSYYQPTTNMTKLRNKTWQGKVTAVEPVSNQPNILRIKAVIPSSVGGFTIREMGALNSAGQLIAVTNTPDMQKVVIADGVSSELQTVIEIAISNAEVVNFTVDPTVIIATKQDIADHAANQNLHVTATKQQTWDAKPGPTHNHSGQGGGMEGDTDGSGGLISYNYLTDKPEKMAPSSHAEVHSKTGTDPITPQMIGALSVEEAAAFRGDLSKQDNNIIDLALEVEVLKGAALTGVNANIIVESFLNLNDVTLTNGVYDQASRKIYLP